MGTVSANCWYRCNWLLGLLTGVDGMTQILPVAMAIQANLDCRDENISLLRDFFLVVHLFLAPTEEKILSVVSMASDLLFLCLRSQEDALTKVLVCLLCWKAVLTGYQLIVT